MKEAEEINITDSQLLEQYYNSKYRDLGKFEDATNEIKSMIEKSIGFQTYKLSMRVQILKRHILNSLFKN